MNGWSEECEVGNGGIFGGGSVRSCTGFIESRSCACDVLLTGTRADAVLTDKAGGEEKDFAD